MADGSGPGSSREVDCLVWPGEINRLMRLRGKDAPTLGSPS
jgi:hypothetical protein